MHASAASAITVRRPEFEWPDDLGLLPIPDDPEASCELLALSFTLPYLEPYLIRTMRSAAKLIDDPVLRADMKAFSGQEAQHYRQHARINDLVRARLSPRSAAAMRELEHRLETDYRRFTDARSDRFNLAYAEGFEAMTFAFARSMLDRTDAASTDPSWAGLMLWHLAEEIEHRTVTFDAYEAAFGSWPHRTGIGLWSQAHFLRFIVAMATVCRRDLVPEAATRRQTAWYSLRRHIELGTARGVISAHSPRYDPRDVALPQRVVELAALTGIELV